MSDTTTPNPNRRLLVVILMLAIATLGLGSIYVKALVESPPQWVELAMPLMMALFGLVYWLAPELSLLSPTWRRRFVSFFFAMSALTLILYFV